MSHLQEHAQEAHKQLVKLMCTLDNVLTEVGQWAMRNADVQEELADIPAINWELDSCPLSGLQEDLDEDTVDDRAVATEFRLFFRANICGTWLNPELREREAGHKKRYTRPNLHVHIEVGITERGLSSRHILRMERTERVTLKDPENPE